MRQKCTTNIVDLPDSFTMTIKDITRDKYYGSIRLVVNIEDKTYMIRKPKGPNWDIHIGDNIYVTKEEYIPGHYKLTRRITL